jgi:hypothetical protein
MKKILIVVGIILFFSCKKEQKFSTQPPPQTSISSTTSFQRTFGNNVHFSDVQQSSDNGFILTGIINSADANVLLLKLDTIGNIQWAKSFDAISNDNGYCVRQTTDGGYIICGLDNGAVGITVDSYLIKTDANGNLQWSKSFGGDSLDLFSCVRQSIDGGYIAAGATNSLGSVRSYLIKTNSTGDMQWSKTYGGNFHTEFFSVDPTSDGGYILSGTVDSTGIQYGDVYLLKIDSGGNPLWSKTFGGSKQEWGNCVLQTTDGGYIIGGFSNSFGVAVEDFYLIKTDIAGNLIWSKLYGGNGSNELRSMRQTSDGGYVLSGITTGFSTSGGAAYLVKTDGNGNLQWSATVEYYGSSVGETWQCTDGNFIMIKDNQLIKINANSPYGCNIDSVNSLVTSPATIVNSINTIVAPSGLPALSITTNTMNPILIDSVICIQ